MRTLDRGRFFVTAALLAVLAGCSGPSASGTDEAALPGAQAALKPASSSYMLPRARDAKELLYATDTYNNVVDVYDFHARVQVGQIGSLKEPTRGCVDAKGNVWIAQADVNLIVEYPRASIVGIHTLATSARPFGCAVSPNGDLAVANWNQGLSPGNVEVFKGAAGTPATYTCPGFEFYPYSPAYDDKGNLFVEAIVSPQNEQRGVCVLRAGSNAFVPVSLNVPLHYGGAAVWDGKYVTLTDMIGSPSSTTIYRVRFSHSGGLIAIGQTSISGIEMSQPFVFDGANTPLSRRQGHAFVGPYGRSHIGIWTYPAGVRKGAPFRLIPAAQPLGEIISVRV
jgi:hypothetical protein